MLSKKQIKYLRALAQSYKPTVQIGKFGVSEGTIQSINENLALRSLTKIHVLNNSDAGLSATAEQLADLTDSEVVQVIGRMIVLFRPTEEPQVITLPK